jgi:hypothetical protein
MGGCCARQQEVYFDKKNCFQYSTDEIIKIKSVIKPELNSDKKKVNIKVEDLQLAKIINNIKNKYKGKIKTITEIELFNLAIYNKESFINNDYLIFDMRKSSDQKEEYLKRIKHINYTYDQIKKIEKINKFEILRNFIDHKTIILIIPEYYLNPKNDREGYIKVETYPEELCNLLYNINDSICFNILNSWFNKGEEQANKFEEYLSVFHTYDIIPFILFSYLHLSTFYKEGYFFISFLNHQIFSFDDYINFLNQSDKYEDVNDEINELVLKNKFLSDMNITCIICIDNDPRNFFEVNDYSYQKNNFKEIIIKKNDIKDKKELFLPICDWLKEEIKKGHSCYFNVKNFYNDKDNTTTNYNWLYIIIIIMTIVTEVEYFSILNYLIEKMIYIDNINEIINNINKDELIQILDYLNK